jgi:hypothetical protein
MILLLIFPGEFARLDKTDHEHDQDQEQEFERNIFRYLAPAISLTCTNA